MPPKAAPRPRSVAPDIAALQRARMDASYKMKKAGDKEREKLYADQWAKGGPNRRMTKKSAPRAQDAKPHQTALNRRDAEILEGMVERSAGHIVEIPMRTPFPILQALFAKNLAKRAEKHGMSTASATSLATVAALGLRTLIDAD